MFREWLKTNGVDPKQVQFLETPFPQMNEIMKAGNVDAVVSTEPFQSRIIKAGTGSVLSYFTRELPEDLPIVFFAATRKWATANPAAAKAFRDGLAEGMTQTHANLPEAHATASKYLKLPIEIVSSVEAAAVQDRSEAGSDGAVDLDHEVAGHADQPGERRQAGHELTRIGTELT